MSERMIEATRAVAEHTINSGLGFCPFCGERGHARERRPHGNDICLRNHIYPSAHACITKPTDAEREYYIKTGDMAAAQAALKLGLEDKPSYASIALNEDLARRIEEIRQGIPRNNRPSPDTLVVRLLEYALAVRLLHPDIR